MTENNEAIVRCENDLKKIFYFKNKKVEFYKNENVKAFSHSLIRLFDRFCDKFFE